MWVQAMLAEMKANQPKADADRKSDRENLEGMIEIIL
jgi:hypothetical protein